MATLIIEGRDGTRISKEALPGLSLMEIIRSSGFPDFLALCGGSQSCATCHIYIDDASGSALLPIGEDEEDLLSSTSVRQANSRLSCQIPFSNQLDGVVVKIAPEE